MTVEIIVRVHLEDVRPWFLHDMGEAEQMKQSFSYEAFSLAIATQCLTDLGLIGFSCYLFKQKTNKKTPNGLAHLNLYTVITVHLCIYSYF